jgi:hypothetical protein
VSEADATNTAGRAVVEAPKSLKQITSKDFAATEQSGQDQGRVHLPLDFFREALIGKEFFFEASNAAVADLMRLPTSASEVRE